MRLPFRIIAPVILALILAGAVGSFFLWQIKRSVEVIDHAGRIARGARTTTMGDDQNLPLRISNQSAALAALREGEILERSGQLQRAEEQYRASVEAGGGIPALQRLTALQLIRQHTDAAAETIRALRRADPENSYAIVAEGMLALQRGLPAEATKVLEAAGASPRARLGLAIVAIDQGDHDRATSLLADAASSGDVDVRSAARTLMKAYQEFSLFPDGQIIHRQTLLARALAEIGECGIAKHLLDPVLSEQGRYRDAWIVRGFCALATDDPKGALSALEQAYALDPSKPETQYFLARTHAALGDPQNAVTFLQYAIINGFEPVRDARRLLASYAQELGNVDLALEQRLLLVDGGSLADMRAYVEQASTIPSSAAQGYKVAESGVARWPDEAGAHALAASAALAAGLPDRAKQHAERALNIDPRNEEAQRVLRLSQS